MLVWGAGVPQAQPVDHAVGLCDLTAAFATNASISLGIDGYELAAVDFVERLLCKTT
jgi:hypothetical protein